MSLERLNFMDICRRQDRDGGLAMVMEVLSQTNPMVQDGPAYAANAPMGNRVTLRSSLPTVAWARINEGYTRSKSTTRQQVDDIGILVGLSEMDAKHAIVHGDGKLNELRWDEAQAFLESMTQEVAQTAIYGNTILEEAAFTGLQPRLETLNTGITSSQVRAHHSSPSGSDYTSIYVVDWGERGVHWIYPPASIAGLKKEDLGKQRVTDVDSNPMTAYVMEFVWSVGMAVKDPRRLARLCNIDISQAIEDTSTLIKKSLVALLNGMPAANGFNRVLYCHRDVLTAMENQVDAKSNVYFSWSDYLGAKTLHFRGHPVRQHDQITIAESLVT